jgi:hypothetical protein
VLFARFEFHKPQKHDFKNSYPDPKSPCSTSGHLVAGQCCQWFCLLLRLFLALDPETGKLIDGDIKAHTVRSIPTIPFFHSAFICSPGCEDCLYL